MKFVNSNASSWENTRFEYWRLPNLNAPYTLLNIVNINAYTKRSTCLLYTSDAADDLLCVDLGGRRIIKKKTRKKKKKQRQNLAGKPEKQKTKTNADPVKWINI